MIRNMYTGEGFKGEKFLTILAAGATILSAVMLIDLAIIQKRHAKIQLDDLLERKRIKSENNNTK